MKSYLRYLLTGLILGLYTEVELKLVAGIKPRGFIIAVFCYPVIISLAYAGSRLLDRFMSSTWRGDILLYIVYGLGGLSIEWTLLGNGPGSNAFQLGMFAMWTTFCFGPRILIRDSPLMNKARQQFWIAFAIAAVLLTAVVLLTSDPKAKIVIVVIGLSGLYICWSTWLLILGWRTRHSGRLEHEMKL